MAVCCIALAPGVTADPAMIECPDHSHVWQRNQCDHRPDAGGPFGFPGAGHGGGGNGGLLGGLLGHLGLGL